MGFSVDGYKIIERRHLDHSGRELLLIEEARTQLLFVVLGDRESPYGAYLGGHNRERVGNNLTMALYNRINTIAEFYRLSSLVRDEIQKIIEVTR